jgi:DnaJ-class molecular chaperone
MKFNLYSTLGVKPKATIAEIKKAYRKIAMENHPDKNPNNKVAAKKMLEANEAYEVLSNPSKKKEYDNALMAHLQAEIEREKLKAEKQERRKTNSTKKTQNVSSDFTVGEQLKEVGRTVLEKVLRTILRR